MNKDRIRGAAQKLKGSIEKTVGKITGNKPLERAGKIDTAKGTVNTAVGKAKDVVAEVVKDRNT